MFVQGKNIISCGILALCLLASCQDKGEDGGDLVNIAYSPEPYPLSIPDEFPEMFIPVDNPLTQEGVQLGRRLFYDPITSGDNTMSCASCHKPELGFADGKPVSPGINGIAGRRSAMSLLNVAYMEKGLNWDGAFNTLEEQAHHPITLDIELNEDWDRLEEELRNHSDYPQRFRKAFGITDRGEISRDLVVKALAQFQRIIIAGGNSRYDKVLRGEGFFTDSEQNGYDMYFDTTPELPDAECGHCHNSYLLTTNGFTNNGLDEALQLTDFPDLGRGEVSNYAFDNGKFRIPSLRNITMTAPYMHDGRFQTLEEVLDHYDSGGHYADNLDPLIVPLGLNEEQKQDILNLLKTFTDTTYLQNPDLTNPFE